MRSSATASGKASSTRFAWLCTDSSNTHSTGLIMPTTFHFEHCTIRPPGTTFSHGRLHMGICQFPRHCQNNGVSSLINYS